MRQMILILTAAVILVGCNKPPADQASEVSWLTEKVADHAKWKLVQSSAVIGGIQYTFVYQGSEKRVSLMIGKMADSRGGLDITFVEDGWNLELYNGFCTSSGIGGCSAISVSAQNALIDAATKMAADGGMPE